MGRWRYTPEGSTTSRIIEGDTLEDAIRRSTREGAQMPAPAAPPLERPPPQDPIGARAPTDVATDAEGRVLTAPFQERAQREALPLGVVGETARQLASRFTGLPLGGGTQFDPLTAGLNVASLLPPVAAARAVPPVVRGAAAVVAPIVKTPLRRILTGAGIGATESAVPAALEGQPPGDVAGAAAGGAVSGGARTAAGEAIGGALNMAVRSLGAEPVRAGVKQNVYEWFENAVPWITTRQTRQGVTNRIPIKTDQDVYNLFVKGEGFTNLSDNFGREVDHVVQLAGNPQVNIPVLAQKLGTAPGTLVGLDYAIKEAQKMGRAAYAGAGKTEAQQLARETHRKLLGEIETEIRNLPNGAMLGPMWDQARTNYREGLALLTFVQKVPKLTAEGRINIQAIRSATEQAKTILTMSKRAPQLLDDLIDQLNRGGGPLQGVDVAGVPPGLAVTPPRMGPGGNLLPGVSLMPGQVPTVPGWNPVTANPSARTAFDAFLTRTLFGPVQ
jgi:hypothetical protein